MTLSVNRALPCDSRLSVDSERERADADALACLALGRLILDREAPTHDD